LDPLTHPGTQSAGTATLPDQIVGLIITVLRNDRGVHAETAIAAAAVITGEQALRAAGHDLSTFEPGSVIMSDKVNELLFEGDGQMTISDFFFNALFSQGIDVGKNSWPEQIPDEHQLMMDPLQVAARLRPDLAAVFESAGTAPIERAYACAQATAQLVAQTRRVLDPNIGKALALEAMLRGAKTAPVS
jgi:hypothetical protein